MVFAIWLPLLVGLSVASGAVGTNFHTSFTLPNSESKRVQDTLQSIGGGEQAGSVAQIVFTAPQGTADPAVQAAMSAMFTKVAALPGVKVTSPYSPEGQRFNSPSKPISFAQLSVTQRTQTQNMALAKQIEAIGDTVNVAARLQAAARPGSVTVGEATYRATREVISFAALEEPALLVDDIRAFFRPLRFGAAND